MQALADHFKKVNQAFAIKPSYFFTNGEGFLDLQVAWVAELFEAAPADLLDE
nr:hypothetical protein [Candidatus Sigynarchaeota archaeon]